MKILIKLLKLTCIGAFSSAAHAQTELYFGDGGNGSDGNSGVWDTTTQDWNTVRNLSTATKAVWTNNDIADFGGSAANLTVSPSGVFAEGITFDTADYTLSYSTVTLDADNGSAPTITLNASYDTISSTLSGSAGLSTTGTGLLIFDTAPTVTGTYTIGGSTTLQLGTGSTAAAANFGYINSTTANTVAIGTGATLAFDDNNNESEFANITGTGNVTVSGYRSSYLNMNGNIVASNLTVNLTQGNSTASNGNIFLAGGSAASQSSTSIGSLTIDSGYVSLRAGTGAGATYKTLGGLTGTGGALTTDGSAENIILNGSGVYSYAGTVGKTADILGTSTADTFHGDAISVTHSGTGFQTIGAANWTGSTSVTAGTLELDNGHLTAGQSITSGITAGVGVSAGAVFKLDQGTAYSGTSVVAGTVAVGITSIFTYNASGSGLVNMESQGLTGEGNALFSNAEYGYYGSIVTGGFTNTGTTTINLTPGGGQSSFGTFFAEQTNSLSAKSVVDLQSGILEARGSQTIAGLNSTGTSQSASYLSSDANRNLDGSPVTVTISSANESSYLYGGVIGAASNAGLAAGSNSLGIMKTGAGVQTLLGANTYTGATTVTGGTLFVDAGASGKGGIFGTSLTTVGGSSAVGATLAGDGTINGATVNAFGTLSPGVTDHNDGISIHTFTLNSTAAVTMNRGSTLSFFLDTGSPSTSLSLGSNALTITAGANLQFALGYYALSAPVGSSWVLVTGAGDTNGAFTTLNGVTLNSNNQAMVDGEEYTLLYNDDADVILVDGAVFVPEPPSWLLMAISLSVLGFIHLRLSGRTNSKVGRTSDIYLAR